MPNIIKVVQITVDPGVTVNTTRRKGDTSKQILLTVNKSTILDVRTAEAPPPPAQSITVFSASASSVLAGSPVKLSWSVSNATVVRLNGAVVATNMVDFVVTPTADTVYELEADGSAQTVSATVSITVTQPSPLPVELATFVQITDAPADGMGGDGPTWVFANKPLLVRWKKPGGDWRDQDDTPHGMNPYARITADAVRDFSADVTTLVARLLVKNTGIYILQESGLSNIASRNDGNPANDPRLHIVTSDGAFDPPCIVDTWISPSTNSLLGADTIVKNPILLRFDLSGITGTLQSATLTLACVTVYAIGPGKLAIHYLDCPPLAPQGPIAQGIAATLAKDADLANHPDVLIYDNITSLDYIGAHFQGIAGYSASLPAGTRAEIVDWPQYGLKAVRVWNDANAERLISWHHWMEPKQNPAQSWQRDFGDGYQELYFRYLIEIGGDVWENMRADGAKMPGLAGTYNWSTSGAPTQPEPSDLVTWEARLWHSGVSRAHPYWFGGEVYLYAAEHSVAQYYGQGNDDPRNQFVGCWQAKRVLHAEQRVKLNTIAADGTPNSDGIIEVWIDGVKVLSRLDVKLRGADNVRIQDTFVNLYHGGTGPSVYPAAPCHYDIGGLCVSKSYVGPPKLLTSPPAEEPPPTPTPDPVPTGPLPVFTPTRDASGNVSNYGALPLRAWHEIADTKMVKLLPQLPQSNANDMNNVMVNWGGSANDPATGDMHLHGGAHGANGENNGWYTFNADRADWRITVPPLYMGPIEKAYLDKCAKLYYPNDPNAAYQGSWNMGMPPEFLFLPVPGSVTGDPTLDNPNAASSGKVFPHHCWWKMVWVDWIDGGRAFVSLMHMYLLDPKTGKVTVLQKHNDTDWQYNTADPVTKRIYGLTRAFSANEYWDFREYDPVADTPLVNYPLQGIGYSATYSFSANNLQVTAGREITHFNPITKGWFAFNMDTKKWRALMWQPLPFQSGAGDYAGVYYNGKILACQGWGKVYEVDPATGAVAPFAVSGPDTFGSTAVNNGLFGRLYLRGNLLFALDWATSNAKVMRLQ